MPNSQPEGRGNASRRDGLYVDYPPGPLWEYCAQPHTMKDFHDRSSELIGVALVDSRQLVEDPKDYFSRKSLHLCHTVVPLHAMVEASTKTIHIDQSTMPSRKP